MISIIIPVLNESENIAGLATEIDSVMIVLDREYEVIFIDDGSTDGTLDELKQIAGSTVRYLSFSRNFGKEAAIIAGLENAHGDAVIIMDGDMQHPPSMISEMIEQFEARLRPGGRKKEPGRGALFTPPPLHPLLPADELHEHGPAC